VAHLRLDFLTCDCCGEFWAVDHSPGPMAHQRADARRVGGWVGDRCAGCAQQCPVGRPCQGDVADQVTGFGESA